MAAFGYYQALFDLPITNNVIMKNIENLWWQEKKLVGWKLVSRRFKNVAPWQLVPWRNKNTQFAATRLVAGKKTRFVEKKKNLFRVM